MESCQRLAEQKLMDKKIGEKGLKAWLEEQLQKN
jgi:hypothetical protein